MSPSVMPRNMRKIFLAFLFFLITACGVVKKKTTYSKTRKVTVEGSKESIVDNKEVLNENGASNITSKADEIINTALTFSGVRYKYGGTTKNGMDCSGLVYVAFWENDVPLPRISYEMAETGERIKINDVTKGDLLFFKTSKRGKKINHVGVVVAVEDDEIKFIHASTSRGVIVSSLREGFWNYAFVKAARVL
ncbi:MAG: C40 family peptidase [Flavobacteriaceae bacterium]